MAGRLEAHNRYDHASPVQKPPHVRVQDTVRRDRGHDHSVGDAQHHQGATGHGAGRVTQGDLPLVEQFVGRI